MLSWGILSGAMAFIPAIGRATGLGNEPCFYLVRGLLGAPMACFPASGRPAGLRKEHNFYLVRVLLGAAEAGFFPGIIFYLTLWFPREYSARMFALFNVAVPLSSVIGAPVLGLLIEYLNGAAG